MPVQQGTVLGRYRLLERAGQGGMSTVWKAEDEMLHRTVAVKVIHQPIAADPTYRERFLREARLVAGLEHPNVLPVYDFGSQTVDGDETSYLVMPLVTGGSMKGRITGPVPFPLAVSWLSAIASALDHAHGKGILHRDVKPANVLLDSRGTPLLADFGLARSADSVSGLTVTGTVLGTPLYMSPEQATGGTLDARADQYALAVIAFELLTGRVPFMADSPIAVLHQHVAVPPVPVTSVLTTAPKAVDDVMARALAKEPAKRFPSCMVFVLTLGEALGVPVSATTLPAPQAADTLPTRGKPSLVGSQVATVVSGPKLDAAKMAAPASKPALTPRTGKKSALIALAAILVVSAAGGIFFLLQSRGKAASISSSALPAAPSESASRVNELQPNSPFEAKSNDTARPGAGNERETAATNPVPFSPIEEKSTAASHPTGGGVGEPPSARGPKQRNLSGSPGGAARPHLGPLLRGAQISGDTGLAAAWQALDNSRRPGGRLERADFVSAMGAARQVLATRPGGEARFLDAFSRAGVAFADGRNAEAWQLLGRALENGGGATETRTLRFVHEEVNALGPNPGPDGNWVMGLAFADVRSDLEEELRKAESRAPDSPRLRSARFLTGER